MKSIPASAILPRGSGPAARRVAGPAYAGPAPVPAPLPYPRSRAGAGIGVPALGNRGRCIPPAPDLGRGPLDGIGHFLGMPFREHQELEERFRFPEHGRIDTLKDNGPVNIAEPAAGPLNDRIVTGFKNVHPFDLPVSSPGSLGYAVILEREYLPDRAVVPAFPDRDPAGAVFKPECPGPLAKGKGLFKHAVGIEHETPQDLLAAYRIVLGHHAGCMIEEVKPTENFLVVEHPYSPAPVLVEPGNTPVTRSCMLCNNCICQRIHLPGSALFF